MIGVIAVVLIVAGIGLSPNVAHAEQRTPNNNSYWANRVITEAVNAHSASDLMNITDEYWSGWRGEWLNKYAMYAFGIKAHTMWNSLTTEQQQAVEAVIKDGSTDDTLYIGTTCGLDKGDSCSEDYISMAMTAAMTKNLYPQVATQIGVGKLNSIERAYINKTFSTQNGWYGLVREKSDWDSKVEVKMYNHYEENPVYAGILIMGMNNARYTYLLSGNTLPSYYRNANITPLFHWIQEKAYADGHAYLDDACHTSTDGSVVSCNDHNVAKAVPGIIPAGRYMKAVFGSGAFTPGSYTFIMWNTEGAGGNFNTARSYFYNMWNPSASIVRRITRRSASIVRRVTRSVPLSSFHKVSTTATTEHAAYTPVSRTHTTYTPTHYTPTRYTPIHYTPTRYTPIHYTPTSYAPAQHTSTTITSTVPTQLNRSPAPTPKPITIQPTKTTTYQPTNMKRHIARYPWE